MADQLFSLSSAIEWGVATKAFPGQSFSGDQYLVHPCGSGVLIAAIDGIGHGKEARHAANKAVDTLLERPREPITALVKRCHASLPETRGVVMTLARLNVEDETLSWLGVGNVEGCLMRANPQNHPVVERVLLRGGVVGSRLPALYTSEVPLEPNDLLIFVSDGIHRNFLEGLAPRSKPQRIAEEILKRHANEHDDALSLVVRYLGKPNE